jgi:hypothetical protein
MSALPPRQSSEIPFDADPFPEMKEPRGVRGSFTVRNHGGTRQSGLRTKQLSNAAVYGEPQVKQGPLAGPMQEGGGLSGAAVNANKNGGCVRLH